MTITITFRTTDNSKWGTGQGSNLSASQVDVNFWNLKDAFENFTVPDPITIQSVTVAGTDMYFHMSDDSVIGPIAMPVLSFRYLGEWQPNFAYEVLDTFFVNGEGIFTVEQAHTSGDTFDPNIMVGTSPALLQLFGATGFITDATLASLADVRIDSSVAPGDFLVYDQESGPTGVWVAKTPDQAASLIAPQIQLGDLADVTIILPDSGDVLTWNSGLSEWQAQAIPAQNLAELGDVAISGSTLADADVLTWYAATSKWIAAPIPGGGGGATKLVELTDVAISSSLADGDVLTWDTTTNKWIAFPPPAGTGSAAGGAGSGGGGGGALVDRGIWADSVAYDPFDVARRDLGSIGTRAFLCYVGVAAPTGGAAQQWDGAHSGATVITTTNTTNDTATGNNSNAVGNVGKTAGKWYMEFSMFGMSGNNDGWGVAWQDVSRYIFGHQLGNIAGTTGVGSGNWPGNLSGSNRTGIAVDLDNRLFWICPNVAAAPQNWNNSTSNAPGGSGGVAMGTSLVDGSTPVYPLLVTTGSSRGSIMYTLQASLIGAIPTNFAAWVDVPTPNTPPDQDPLHWVG